MQLKYLPANVFTKMFRCKCLKIRYENNAMNLKIDI